jgi:hypothetical protein
MNTLPVDGVRLPEALWAARVLVSAFLGILFLQSGLDKVFDRRGNLETLREHFARSPLAPFVVPMLATVTLTELTAGALSAAGSTLLLLGGTASVAYAGALVAGASLTALFFGQRVAKDYAGAAVLVPYFILAILAVLVLGYPG